MIMGSGWTAEQPRSKTIFRRRMGTIDAVLSRFGDEALAALYRAAKRRGSKKEPGGLRPFFTDPHNMIALRLEMERRGLPLKVTATGPGAEEGMH